MQWFSTVVLYLGIFDAAVILIGGLLAAFVILMGWDAQKMWERIGPALGMVVGSTVAASIMLAVTRWMLSALLIGIFLMPLIITPAFAQETTVAVGGFYALAQPYLVTIAGVIAAAIVGWIAELVRRKFNLDIEARHREALQTALTNGAGLLIARGGDALAGKKIDVKNPVAAAAINYVLAGAPDAIKYFGLTPDAVGEKLAAKLGVSKV